MPYLLALVTRTASSEDVVESSPSLVGDSGIGESRARCSVCSVALPCLKRPLVFLAQPAMVSWPGDADDTFGLM